MLKVGEKTEAKWGFHKPCFLSFLSTRSWFKRSFSLLNSLSFLFISWLYWLARLAIMFWSFWTWQGGNKVFSKRTCLWIHSVLSGGSNPKESTSSFSFFRQFCKLFTFSCSCRSLSSSPVFSLLDSSSCSYDNRTTLAWTFNMRGNFFSTDKQLLRCLKCGYTSVIFLFEYNINMEKSLVFDVTVLLVWCWWAAGSPHCCWT